MRRVLAVSPHLDDAVFSAGGTLARHAMDGDEVTILTCFTGNVAKPQGFALECQLDKGLSAEIDYMALRRAEDLAACEAIGAKAIHLPFLEAPHRGYADAKSLFAGRKETDAPIVADLRAAIASLYDKLCPSIVYGPLGVGNHVDHHVVRDAMAEQSAGVPVVSWEDFPYAMKSEAVSEGVVRRPLDAPSAAAKLRSVLCYKTQLGFQFGSAEHAADILSQWTVEGFVSDDLAAQTPS